MRKLAVLGAFLGVVIFSGTVFAGDLVGEWQAMAGRHSGALSGTPGHAVRTPGDHFTTDVPWVLKITAQEGAGLQGQWCSPKKCEPLVGVIRKDGSMLMVDEDTTFLATMYGDEMEVCVTEPGKSFRVAACNTLKKK